MAKVPVPCAKWLLSLNYPIQISENAQDNSTVQLGDDCEKLLLNLQLFTKGFNEVFSKMKCEEALKQLSEIKLSDNTDIESRKNNFNILRPFFDNCNIPLPPRRLEKLYNGGLIIFYFFIRFF